MYQFSNEQGRRLFTPYSQQVWSQSGQGYSGTHDIGDQASLICILHHNDLSKLSYGPHLLLELQSLSHILANRKENGKEEGRNKGDNFAFKIIPSK